MSSIPNSRKAALTLGEITLMVGRRTIHFVQNTSFVWYLLTKKKDLQADEMNG